VAKARRRAENYGDSPDVDRATSTPWRILMSLRSGSKSMVGHTERESTS